MLVPSKESMSLYLPVTTGVRRDMMQLVVVSRQDYVHLLQGDDPRGQVEVRVRPLVDLNAQTFYLVPTREKTIDDGTFTNKPDWS